MSDAKFTPGPWAVDNRASFCVNAERDGAAGGVCSTGGYYASWRDGEELMLENQANAHLIAAAPELYEALERMVADYDIGEMTETPILDVANAALAKARGETEQ